jgi:hypothetical protein
LPIFVQLVADNTTEPTQPTPGSEVDVDTTEMTRDPAEGSLPNDLDSDASTATPHNFHPPHRQPERRVVTIFSEYDGSREAAATAGSM